MIRIFLYASIAGLVIWGAFYFFSGQQHPQPSVLVGGTPIPVAEGSYCWDSLLTSECVDKGYASPFEMGTVYEPVHVSPEEEIEIYFDHRPIEGSVQVERWTDATGGERFQPENGKFLAPQQSGLYVYHIMAQWEKGDGSYAFSINVQ